MELMQLQMFVAAAEEESLQKAAGRVSRTPQAVSMAIGKLEEEVGLRLFERSARGGFRLTSAGDVLFEYAKRALSIVAEARVALEEIRTVKGGRLRIGTNQSLGDYFVPRLTSLFRHAHPSVRVRIVMGYTEAVLGSLRRHDVDVALVADKPQDAELKAELLLKDRLVALINPDHSMAKQQSLPLAALGTEALILLTEPSELRERIVGIFRRYRIPLNAAVETGTLESIKKMVAQNMGIGIVPLLCVRNEDAGNLIVKTIEHFQEDRSLWLVYPRMASPACEAFTAIVRSEIITAK